MVLKLRSIALALGLFCLTLTSLGQTVVTVGGGASVTCPATPTATWTTPPTGVSLGNWSRGSGVTCGSAANGLSGSAFNTASAAASFSGNKYYSVTITADAIHTFTLSSVVWSTAVSSGGCTFDVQYKNNGGALTAFGTAAQTNTSSNTFTGSVVVAANTSIILYLIPSGTGATGTTVRWVNGSTITVTAALAGNDITVTQATGGTISPGTTTVASGGSQSFTATPAACYSFTNWVVDGANAGSGNPYTFTNVLTTHTITAVYTALGPNNVTASTGANGTVTPSGATSVACGGSQTYAITPASCYSVSSVLVDGISQGAITTYTFTNVTAPHTISATFGISASYNIVASAGANGTVTPAGTTAVPCGNSQTYTITPNACYNVLDVLVDGVSQGAITTYTFTNVLTTHTISATFVLKTFGIAASAGANGTVTPSGTTTVNCGSNQTYTITPSACYHVLDVLVDGGSVGAVGTYTFTNVTAAHTISATFAINASSNIVASAGANGSISPNGTTVVACGGSQAYTITANSGYAVSAVTVDGVGQGAITTYTFTNVTTAHTISVTFVAVTITTSPLIPNFICPGGTVSVPYTISSTIPSTTFNAQLSDASGVFANTTSNIIGTLTSTTSGTITATIPSSTANGTGYRIRVLTSTIVGSDNTQNITIQYSTVGTILTESMGTVGATTAIATQEAANGFDNDGLTMTGTGDLRNTTNSTGYTGASGGANVFITTTTGLYFQIAGINTSAYNTVLLTFGAFKNVSADVGAGLGISVSSDGTTFSTPVPLSSIAPLPAGASWSLVKLGGIIPISTTAAIKFVQLGTASQYRIDDVNLYYGVATVPSITPSAPAAQCGGAINLTASPNLTDAASVTWSTTATTSSISVGSTGSYSATITDGFGCISNQGPVSVTINIPVTPSVTIANSNTWVCAGVSNTFTATPVNGGTPTYQWRVNGSPVGSGGNTYTAAANSLSQGDVVTVDMTSTLSCITTATVSSNSLTAQKLAYSPVATFTESFGASTITDVSGYTSPLGWVYTPNASSVVDLRVTSPSPSGGANMFFTGTGVSPAGNKIVVISNINTTTTFPNTLSFEIFKAGSITTMDNSNFNIEVSADGINYTQITYTPMSGSATWSTLTFNNVLPKGTNIRLRFTNAIGGSSTPRIDNMIISGYSTADASITPSGTITLCSPATQTLNALPNPGSGLTYAWSNSTSGTSIVVNSTSTSSVTLTDVFGCQSSASQLVTINTPTTWYLDADNDGHYVSTASACTSPGAGYNQTATVSGDCNDADNTKWQNLNGYVDVDGDGYTVGSLVSVCSGAALPLGYSATSLGTDCNDNNAAVHAILTWYLDADNDGHYVSSQSSCGSPGAGYNLTATISGDCNDNDNTKWQNLSGYVDVDGDGYTIGSLVSVCTGAALPSGYSATSSGTDCDDNNPAAHATLTWYLDADNDGHYVSSQSSCGSPGAGYNLTATFSGDCNDNDNTKWQNLNGYVDVDGDGYTVGSLVSVCTGAALPSGYSATSLGTDCNDNNGAIHPGAIDICGNTIDEDCNGSDLVCSTVNTWLGNTTQWGLNTNWSNGVVPNNCADDVLIPTGLGNYPQIAGAFSVGNLTLQAGATISVGLSLTVCGNLTGSAGAASQILGNGYLVFTGANKTITGYTKFSNVDMQGTYTVGVAAGDKVEVTGILKKTSGSLATADKLTLKSTASQTGLIQEAGGTLTGKITMERYIPGTAVGYRELSSPVNSIVSDWAADFLVQGTNGVNCWYNYQPYPTLQYYKESDNTATDNFFGGFFSFTSISLSLTPMKGYAAQITTAPLTITTTGIPNNGPKSIVITKTASASPPADGWNLVGNPYPGPVSWNAIKGLNAGKTDGSSYRFIATAAFAGNWATWNGVTGTNGATDEIASTQGFWVLANSNTTLTMDNSVRTAGLSPTFFKTRSSLPDEVRLELSNGTLTDEIVSYSDVNASLGYDVGYDAVKMAAGSAVYISFDMPDKEYAINVLDAVTEQTELPLLISVSDSGTYTITATSLNLNGLTAYLKDAVTNTLYDLSVNAPSFTFNAGQSYTGRFSIVFKSTVVSGIANSSEAAVRIYSSGDKVFVERNSSNAATVSIANVLGQQITEFVSNQAKTEIQLSGSEIWYAFVKVTEGTKVSVAKVLISNK